MRSSSASTSPKGTRCVVILGDNIIEDDITPYRRALQGAAYAAPASCSKRSTIPQRFGVPDLRRRPHRAIEEKPADPKSKYAVTGIYMYDHKVFDYIRTLVPSGRGELEIVDVHNRYISENELEYDILDGWWTDAGTFPSLFRATELVARERGRG